MKLNNHELLLFTDENYRENVLKSQVGRESAQDLLDDLNKNKEEKNNGRTRN